VTSPTVQAVRDALKAAADRAVKVRTAAEAEAERIRAERDAQAGTAAETSAVGNG